jgi:hypothetical protein
VAAGLGACGEPDDDAADELRRAMNRTALLARQFNYQEETATAKVEVRGIVEDDFRYKARLLVRGSPALDEVVSDDAIVDRFIDPNVVDLFIEPKDLADASPELKKSSVEALDHLRSSRWVLDPAGAPGLLSSTTERRDVGTDPIYDALTVFRYVEQVMINQAVRRYNKNDLEYRPKEDPFPRPPEGSDVTRYDFVRIKVPRPTDGGGANQTVPGAGSFRKMAVYVKDGLVYEVREDVDVASRLADLQRNYDIDLEKPGLTTNEAIATAIEAINAVIEGQGGNPIRVRKMTLQLRELGKVQNVKLPEVEYVEADLTILRNRGRATARPDRKPGAPASTTTTSAPTAAEPAPAG